MNVAVLGAGNSGLAMAAHLAASGERVRLWNRTRTNLADIIGANSISCSGIVEGDVHIDCATDDMREALDGADIVMVTTPASAHVSVARAIGDLLVDGVPVLLNPGRTFGAIRFADALGASGAIVAEAQTIVYTCRRIGLKSVHVYSLKRSVKLACLDSAETPTLLAALPNCLCERFSAANSILETSLGNVGPMLHCAPFLLNVGWTESESSSYKYYYDGITPSVGALVERMDAERLAVAESLGVRVDSVIDWMKAEYPTSGTTLFECVRNNDAYREIDAPSSLKHRYIYEDVPYGLVQFESLGNQLGIKMPHITAVIDMACALLGEDFRIAPTVSLERIEEQIR